MIEAALHEGTERSGYGTFRFVAIPSPGDQIFVGNIRGSIDVLLVLHVEHHPVKLPVAANARPDPYIAICVRYVSSFGD